MGIRVPGPLAGHVCGYRKPSEEALSFMWSFSLVITLQTFSAGVFQPGSHEGQETVGTPTTGLGRYGPVFIKAAVVFLWPNWNSVVGWETGYLGVRPDFTFTVWSWVSYLSFLNFSFFNYEMDGCWFLPLPQQHADLLPKNLVKISCSTQIREILKTG